MIDSPRSVVVTGGGRGIGAAIAARFAKEGYGVLACGRAAKPDNLPAGVAWAQADVSKEVDVNALFAKALRLFGFISVLVNNAGTQTTKKITESTDADWDEVIGTNALGVFRCSRAAIPLMIKHGGGIIINIGSISGLHADPGMALYNASKAFVHGLTRSISVDHGGEGIRCNAICPGWIETVMAGDAFSAATNPAKARQDALARHPVGRLGSPADVAALAAWLASDDAAFISGQTFVTDGGLIAGSPIQPHLF
jgi:meso-butanediol dehydrogenase/(S,S)-butanediol dehydrogenase/diacetyl reductase